MRSPKFRSRRGYSPIKLICLKKHLYILEFSLLLEEMALSSYKMHRIYLAATMNYGLGSDDPEELAYYNKIRKKMDDMNKQPIKKGISLNWDTFEGMDK